MEKRGRPALKQVILLMLAESLLLCVLAAFAGLGLAALMMPGLAAKLPGLGMNPGVLIGGGVIAVLLALVVGVLPALRAMRLDIVNALSGH